MDKTVVTLPEDIKNAKGELGPMCSNCAGFGFTIIFGTNEHRLCSLCDGTGVPRVDLVDLQSQVIKLTNLVKVLHDDLKEKGLIGKL